MPPATPRRVVFLSGTRADFGKLKPLIQALSLDPAFGCTIFATGMHLLARYGSTIDEIRKSGFSNIFSFINQIEGANAQMDVVLAQTIQGFAFYVREHRPDLIVVHGDRVETLAGAIVGALNGILVAHIEGGELSGTVDELIRHAVTKLSHTHFVANEEARTRLIQMGESSASIFVVGSPDIDVMLSESLPSILETRGRYEIPFEHYHVFIYHPVVTELADLRRNVEFTFAALERCGENFVLLYPNNDTGSSVILELIEGLREHPRFRILPSLRFEHFLTLLKHARSIVGNSSAGIREAPVYGVPTINIGTRQQNRYSHDSIHDVAERDSRLERLLNSGLPRTRADYHFGRGDSASLFHQRLLLDSFWQVPRQKLFQDIPFHHA